MCHLLLQRMQMTSTLLLNRGALLYFHRITTIEGRQTTFEAHTWRRAPPLPFKREARLSETTLKISVACTPIDSGRCLVQTLGRATGQGRENAVMAPGRAVEGAHSLPPCTDGPASPLRRLLHDKAKGTAPGGNS